MKHFLLALVTLIAFTGCKKDPSTDLRNDVVYFQTNNFHGNNNAVLAYKLKSNGELIPLAGSPFATGGSGVGNPMQRLGPSDSDRELKMSADGKYMLVVNSGSNNITVFRVWDNGRLTPVSGSPFPSGGETPASIDVRGNHIYIVNKSDNPVSPTTTAPNYTVFTINGEGQLTHIPNSTVATTPGSSPANILLSNDNRLAFGTDFLGFQHGVGTLRSFGIANNGFLDPVTGTPQAIPGMGGALGLWQHPLADVLYVGFPLQGKIGVYNINPHNGQLSFNNAVDAGLAACWLRATKDGRYLYALNSGENTISMYNSSNPASLVSLGKLTLKNSGPSYMALGLSFTTSEPFSFEFSSSQNELFVLNQHTNADFSIGNYNYLHVVKIAPNGTLSEPGEPLQLPVPNTFRPKGVIVHNTHADDAPNFNNN